MNVRPFFRFLARAARAHPHATRWLVGAPLAWAAACFALGYRVPGFDQHPDWPQFPHTTNPRLHVEHIPDFEQRYGRRFPFVLARQDAQQWDFSDVYRTNLRNVRSLGYTVTGNEFKSGFSFHWTGPNDVGRSGGTSPKKGFRNNGFEYIKVNIKGKNGFFKSPFSGEPKKLTYFYQYNYPKNIKDTLYIHELSADWRVIYR